MERSQKKAKLQWDDFRCKLHMIINHASQMIAIKITQDNIDNRTPVTELTKKLKGSIYDDKRHIGDDLFKALYKKRLKAYNWIRKNIKNYLIDLTDKKLLRKRFCIETIWILEKFYKSKAYQASISYQFPNQPNSCSYCLFSYQKQN